MIADNENIARAIFSPCMIINGVVQPEAFCLRSSIQEEYISVMRMSFPFWLDDVKNIPQRKNRKLYGYAEMLVNDIRSIQLKGVLYDVRECPTASMPSHAGIFITVNGENLVGGKMLSTVTAGVEQDFLTLAIQRELVDIAQKGLHEL